MTKLAVTSEGVRERTGSGSMIEVSHGMGKGGYPLELVRYRTVVR